MKVLFVAVFLLSSPAIAQVNSNVGNGGTWSSGHQIQAFNEGAKTADRRPLEIDRRRAARVQAARMARKARAAEEREARQAAAEAAPGR